MIDPRPSAAGPAALAPAPTAVTSQDGDVTVVWRRLKLDARPARSLLLGANGFT